MPSTGVSKVTKAGSLPAMAPCHAVPFLRMLPGLLLTRPRVMVVLLRRKSAPEGALRGCWWLPVWSVGLGPEPSARPILLAGESLLDVGELLADFLEQALPLDRRIGLDALDHGETHVVNGDRRLEVGIGEENGA